MHRFSKVFGIALAGLSMGYAAVLITQEVSSDQPALPSSLQYVLSRAGWEPSAFVQLKAWANTWVTQSSRAEVPVLRSTPVESVVLPTAVSTHFAAVAGGGAPSYNEIALEKNVLYFQRSLLEVGLIPRLAHFFFANGNDGQKTVRYLDEQNRERFKAPEIPDLNGAANYGNTRAWFEAIAQAEQHCPAFFYFTGHGITNPENEDNNFLLLWEEVPLSVQEMALWLDPLPADQPFVAMMAQCYSGSFANLIYEKGDPKRPVALQTRCGFFATVASRPSVGCTAAVNESDYQDYSSSFFAGLTGRDRVGRLVESADYNQDNKISYAEAHAFAKVDEETTDWPISTVEAWLQKQVSDQTVEGILAQPMADWLDLARPEQQHVIDALTTKLEFNLNFSYVENQALWPEPDPDTVNEAYQMRLKMEIINVGVEALLRAEQNPNTLAILEQILACEAGTW